MVDMGMGVFLVYASLTLLGMLGNAVVVMLTLRNSGRRISPADLLISHLSLANFCSILTRNTPALFYQAFGEGAVGGTYCKVFGFFCVLTGSMSAWLTVLLSVYRTFKLYVNQSSFFLRTLQSTTSTNIFVATIWIIWGIILSPTITYLDKDLGCRNQTAHGNDSNINGYSSLGNIRSYFGCVLSIGHTKENKVYAYSCLVLSEILPAAMILIASTMILCALRNYRKILLPAARLPNGHVKVNNWVGPVPRSKAHWRAGWLVLALMATYLACWATHFTVLAVSFSRKYLMYHTTITVGRLAYAFYPVLCPYALAMGNRKFQTALRNSFCQCAA